MRSSPSIVPGTDRDIYLVLDDFGSRLGRAWAETDEEHTYRDTLLRHLMEGCPSSDDLRPIRYFENGGSGSSGVRV